jgi:hypothetical protein
MPPVAFYNIKIASRSKSIEKSVVHDLERKQKGSKSRRASTTEKHLSGPFITQPFFAVRKGENRAEVSKSSMQDELLLDLRPLDFIKTPGARRRVIESQGRP